jgi:hypothetical protein
MAIQQSMSFLLLLVVISAGAGLAAGSPSSVITSACSAVAKDVSAGSTGDRYKRVYEECVGMLSAYPEAVSAVELRGLAFAAADLTAANVTNMDGFLQDLQGCLGAYKAMGGTVAGRIQDLRDGRIVAAVIKLNNAATMPNQCFLPYMYAEKQSHRQRDCCYHWPGRHRCIHHRITGKRA